MKAIKRMLEVTGKILYWVALPLAVIGLIFIMLLLTTLSLRVLAIFGIIICATIALMR